MLGERACLVAAFQSSDEKLAEALAVMGDSATAAPPSMLRFYRSGGHLQKDFAFALDYMSNVRRQPLRYEELPARGYTVNSVGADREDDGGAVQGPDVKPPPRCRDDDCEVKHRCPADRRRIGQEYRIV